MGYDPRTMDVQTVEHRSASRSSVDRLYDRLLRDFFARTVPGFLLLLALAVAVTSFVDVIVALERATIWMWLVAFGAGWLVSLALLELGRRCSLVLLAPDGVTDTQYWAAEERFRTVASRRQRAEYERLLTVREAAATASVSILASLLILGVDFVLDAPLHESPWNDIRNGATAVVVVAVLAIALQLLHRNSVKRVWAYLGAAIESRKA